MIQRSCLACVLLLTLGVLPANAGRILISHDEWTLSNVGFVQAGGSNAATFALNVADFMNVGGGPGSFLVYSSNFGFIESEFLNTLTGAGHSVTVDTGLAFDLATLSAFDGIFLAGDPYAKNDSVLANYVNAGGSVYIAGGAVGDPDGEAAQWNSFLNGFGLNFIGGTYNGCCTNDAVTGTHDVFLGVSALYSDNGNVVGAFGPNSSIIEFSAQGMPLLAAYDHFEQQSVPEPGLLALLAAGAAAAIRRRRCMR